MFKCLKFGVCRSKGCKVTSCQFGGLKKKSAGRPWPQSASLPGFDSRSRSNHSESLMAGNFADHWPTDPKFSAFKHLNLLKKHTKNQEASSILRVVFTLSKWPHLHREWPKKRVFLQGTVYGLEWKLWSSFVCRINNCYPMLCNFVVGQFWSKVSLLLKYLSICCINFWKIVIFDKHVQYAHQMKAENM